MTRACGHENADHLMPGDVLTPMSYAPIEQGWPVLVEQFRCLDCGDYLSLGPANDVGVEHEIRAAELADDLAESDRLCDWTFGEFGDDEERRGFSIAETNMQAHSPRWHAGYLARCIVEHTTCCGGEG